MADEKQLTTEQQARRAEAIRRAAIQLARVTVPQQRKAS